MRVRLLGPVDVVTDGESRPVSGLRRKAVLAVLALHHGEIVSNDRLAEVVWAGDPPAAPLNTVQRHISHLRQVLGRREAIAARPPGYRLDPVQVETDVTAAERLIRQGAQAADHAHARQLREALALWRGQPLADVAGLPWLEEQAGRLEQLRLRASRALAQTRLALGEHAQVLPELEALVKVHRFDEKLYAQLMIALYRSGRQADALAACRHLRSSLRDELGIEAGRPLRDLEAAILRQDRALDLAPEAAPSTAARSAVRSAAGPNRAVARDKPEPVDTGPVLLERESPLGSLNEFAAQARRGEGRLVLLGGEAGVGKTVLVEQLQRDLPDARWSWGSCDSLFTPRPLGPLFDLADQLGGVLLERCQAGADREEMFRALLHQASTPEVLDVIVVEDIHWADEATLDLLRYLVRRLRDAAVLLIATYRDDGLAVRDPFRVALGDLASQRCTRRLMLAPLSADAVRALADGSGLPSAELYRLTGGNPFYVTEVLLAGMTQVPPSARDAVLARAGRLGAQSRAVLDVAALAGTRVELRLLEAVTGCQAQVIDELLACGLLAGDGSGWLKFRHEIARLAVAEGIAPHRAGDMHRRILAALCAFGCDDDARLAFHAEAAGDGAAVLEYAPAAARRAASLASHREAAAQLERALRFAAGADTATAAGLYTGLADELALVERQQDAASACKQALDLWRAAGNRLQEGDVLRRLSCIMWSLCRGAEGAAAAEEAVSVLEPLGQTTELAYAYSALASQRNVRGEHAAARRLAASAQAIAEALHIPEVTSDALNTLAVVASRRGEAWTGQMRQALEVALAGRLHEQAARAFCNFFCIHSGKHEFDEAERYFADGLAYCAEHDTIAYANFIRAEQATVLERTGRWDESVALSTELLAEAGLAPAGRLAPATRLGIIRARRGEPGVWEHLDEAAAIADASGEPFAIIPVRTARAEAYWLESKPARARHEAELAEEASAHSDPWVRGEVALWLHITGSAKSAQGEMAGPYRLHRSGAWTKAAYAWANLGCDYHAALALLCRKEETALREALNIFTSLGASRAATITRQNMRGLGIRSVPTGPRRVTQAHPAGLTTREHEVLRLICAGHANAEIAAELFISARTVHHHVSAILTKLGAANRAAAASEAARLGLVDAAASRKG